VNARRETRLPGVALSYIVRAAPRAAVQPASSQASGRWMRAEQAVRVECSCLSPRPLHPSAAHAARAAVPSSPAARHRKSTTAFHASAQHANSCVTSAQGEV